VPKTAVAVRHVAFEDLGSFEQDLRRAGYEIRYYDIGIDDLASVSTRDPDLLIVLGGPIGYTRRIGTNTPNPASLSSRPLQRHSSFIRAVCVDAHVRIRLEGAQR
jgi:hypothetical protein